MNTSKEKTKEYEKCVSCGGKTTEPVDRHIDYRYYYVEGAGQLCKECYTKIYDRRTEQVY